MFFINIPANLIQTRWHCICSNISCDVRFHNRANIKNFINIKSLLALWLCLKIEKPIIAVIWCQIEKNADCSFFTGTSNYLSSRNLWKKIKIWEFSTYIMKDLHFQICLLVFKLMFRSVVETDVVNSPLNNMVLWHFEIEWFGTPESLEANISSICQINSVYVILRSLPIDWCWSILCYKSKSFGRPINDLFMVVCSIDMCHI